MNEAPVADTPDEDTPDVANVRPGGSADVARDEALPTLSMPIGVRSAALTILTMENLAAWAHGAGG